MAATASTAVVAPAGLEQINRQQCTYTACYCEENVYHLLQHLIESGNKQTDCLFAVFISNSNETVSLAAPGAVQQVQVLPTFICAHSPTQRQRCRNHRQCSGALKAWRQPVKPEIKQQTSNACCKGFRLVNASSLPRTTMAYPARLMLLL
jgi:hypothetical protein